MEERQYENLRNFMDSTFRPIAERDKDKDLLHALTPEGWRNNMIVAGLRCYLRRWPTDDDVKPVLTELGEKYGLWGEAGPDYLAELGSQYYVLVNGSMAEIGKGACVDGR